MILSKSVNISLGIYTASYCLQIFHTHFWCRVTHICESKQIIIGLDNGLSPGRRQAIIWTNAGKLLFGHPVTNFSEILIEIHTFSFKKMHLKMSSGKCRPFCLGLNVLTVPISGIHLANHVMMYVFLSSQKVVRKNFLFTISCIYILCYMCRCISMYQSATALYMFIP